VVGGFGGVRRPTPNRGFARRLLFNSADSKLSEDRAKNCVVIMKDGKVYKNIVPTAAAAAPPIFNFDT
jgi:hypothetical protein